MAIQHEKHWNELYAKIKERGASNTGLYEAIEDYYTLYEDRLLIWLAGLYDSKIGGFYYSNSAKLNEKREFNGKEYALLPDIESTHQAMCLLVASGVFEHHTDLPDKMKEGIQRFATSLLDKENGFFYHPQWGKEMTDERQPRRGRDLTWGLIISKNLGFEYPYPTARERIANSDKNEKTENNIVPDYLRSEQAFRKYLGEFNWVTDSYYAGNAIAAQAPMIIAANLADVTADFLNSIQDKESGLWGEQRGYMAINSYLKISAFYDFAKTPIPGAERAAISVLDCATTDEEVDTVCFQYNVWYSLCNISRNLIAFGGDKGKKEAEELSSLILKNATRAVVASKEKVNKFKKPDASFSYMQRCTSPGSQGMPVALPDTNEGDVNASIICTAGICESIFNALSLPMPPLFSENAKQLFISELKL